jgi:uroporphyrinogen decarboxylase
MDLPEIKKEFGKNLVLHGAVDQQEVLPHGNPQQVAEEIRMRINQLGSGGGYIIAVSPNIQADVSPQNILTLFQTARQAGRYPLGQNG